MNKNKLIRNLALSLLDDQHGINKEAYDQLEHILNESGEQDILDNVKSNHNRYWIEEYDAEQLKSISAELVTT